jgi:4,5-dihydroxyphthalate decarboxylase
MLKTLMGEHPVTKQFLTRKDKFDFLDFKGSAAPYFKRVVRNHEFDVAEMAIITYLIAKSHGTPYRLLPFVVMARYQHGYLVYNSARGEVSPRDLPGRRVGVRSYSVTTGAWIRHILAEDYGLDISEINWVTFEEAHVAEYKDPPFVQRAPAGKDINGMLMAGELDAAILGAIPTDPVLKPVIKDPETAGRRWGEKHGAVQLNHLVVVRKDMPKAQSDEVYNLLVESKKAAGNAPMLPHGIDANRRNFEIAIDCAYKQRLIPRRFTVEELFE